MKKKVVCAILLGCCVLGLSACGKSEAEQAADYYEEELGMNKEDAEELADYIYGEEDASSESEATEEVAEIVVSEEIISAERFSSKVQIGSTVYEFPLTVADLVESGELRISGTDVDKNTNENTLVSPNGSQIFGLSGPGVDIVLWANNNSDSMVELKDCTVEKQAISDRGSSNVIYSGGLRTGMSFSELSELYGEPDYIEDNAYYYYEDMYYFYDASHPMSGSHYASLTGNEYCVSIDMNNACVSSIAYTMGQERRSTDYKEWVLSGEGCNFQCYVPDDLLYYGRLVEANGKKYKMSFNAWVELYDFDGSAESLPDDYWNEEIIEKIVNDDGTAIVMTQGATQDYSKVCKGYYYMSDCAVVFQIGLQIGTMDDTDPIPEAVKQEAYNIVNEIINKGVTVQ